MGNWVLCCERTMNDLDRQKESSGAIEFRASGVAYLHVEG